MKPILTRKRARSYMWGYGKGKDDTLFGVYDLREMRQFLRRSRQTLGSTTCDLIEEGYRHAQASHPIAESLDRQRAEDSQRQIAAMRDRYRRKVAVEANAARAARKARYEA